MKNPVLGVPIERRIYLLRGRRVILDRDLAELYGVPTKVLNQTVKRHANRFPLDFMFKLNPKELKNWKSQAVTSNPGVKMGVRKPPCAFTEQGIAMLSSVLNSERAVQINILIMRAFVKLREIISAHKELSGKLDELERRVSNHDGYIRSLIDAIRQLAEPPPEPPIEKLKTVAGFRP